MAKEMKVAIVSLSVAVDENEFGGEGALRTPLSAARAGYEQMQNMDFYPVVMVEMPDGTKHEIDLDAEGLR